MKKIFEKQIIRRIGFLRSNVKVRFEGFGRLVSARYALTYGKNVKKKGWYQND